MNTTLFSDNSSVDIIYRKTFAKITASTDDIPLPDYFVELIKKYMKAMLVEGMSQTDQSFASMLSADVASVVTGGEYNYITCELPFSF